MRTIHKILTVMGGQSAHQLYINKVKSVQAANLLAFWPQDEKTGTNADNAEGTAARDGTYSGVTLNNTTGPFKGPAGLWDGTNDYTDVYTTSFRDAFNGAEGSISCWAKVSGSGVWTDAAVRKVVDFRVNSANEIALQKQTANHQFLFYYAAGNVAETVTHTFSPSGTTDWFHVVITWSKSNDRVRAYLNGAQTGTDQTTLGTWAGTFDPNITLIGAYNKAAVTTVWSGNLAYCAVWSTELTAANVTTLYNGGPI